MAKRKLQNSATPQKSPVNTILMALAGLVIIGLLGIGMAQVLDFGGGPETAAANVSLDSGDLESVSVEAGSQLESVAAPVDREGQYLGPETDPASLALAEAGQVGQPTLVWFHADWCHVCQQIKPEVVDLGQEFEGQVKFVRINLSRSDAGTQDAVRRYGVRATPTFVLFDATGQIRGQVPGWPGYEAFTGAFGQLLSDG